MRTLDVPLFGNGTVDWARAAEARVDTLPWHESGLKQTTLVRIALTPGRVHVRATAQDRWSGAEARALNGAVYNDSCFEFFVTPSRERGGAYVNFEVNCVGSLHLACGPDIDHRTLSTPAQAAQVEIRTSIRAAAKVPTPEDREWSVELSFPVSLLEEMTGKPADPEVWFANFYRCGGPVEPQYACWSPVEWERPAFHRPEQFGMLRIVPVE